MKAAALVLLAAVLALPQVGAQERLPARGPAPARGPTAGRWERLSEPERNQLRERWHRFQSLPEQERENLLRRAKALDRLRERLRRSAGREPTRDALEQELHRARQHLRRLAPDDAPPPAVRRKLHEQTLRRIRAFLDSLVRQERLSPAARRRLETLPAPAFIREGLALKKREELALEADAPDLERLRKLDPLDVADAMRLRRRQQGLLGAAGRLLALPPRERRAIAEALDAGDVEQVRERLQPRLRKLMNRHGVAPDEIRRVLSLPLRELERELHHMLRRR